MRTIILCIFAIAVTSVLADCGREEHKCECEQHEAPNCNVRAPACGHIDPPRLPRIPAPVVPNVRLPYELPNVKFPCGGVPYYPDHERPHYPRDPHACKTECRVERKYHHCECEKHEGDDDDDVDVCFCKKEKKDDRRHFIRRNRFDDDEREFDPEDRCEFRGKRRSFRKEGDLKERREEIREEVEEREEERKEEKIEKKEKKEEEKKDEKEKNEKKLL